MNSLLWFDILKGVVQAIYRTPFIVDLKSEVLEKKKKKSPYVKWFPTAIRNSIDLGGGSRSPSWLPDYNLTIFLLYGKVSL